ncbi:hypothetical protein GJ744_005173 [Endocarpon pusillum]|uniref:Uncharacterized protein n=1 Tax=Endocarpon pusillum TaxID=364733 RepID=A0A8H7DZS1_9EURO|nr:hypothetical protein GJ744_005173 [Endocarpon pusillum]
MGLMVMNCSPANLEHLLNSETYGTERMATMQTHPTMVSTSTLKKTLIALHHLEHLPNSVTFGRERMAKIQPHPMMVSTSTLKKTLIVLHHLEQMLM